MALIDNPDVWDAVQIINKAVRGVYYRKRRGNRLVLVMTNILGVIGTIALLAWAGWYQNRQNKRRAIWNRLNWRGR